MTRHALQFTLVVYVSLTVCAPLAMPQATSTATVSGQVTDQQGAVIAGASVQLREPTANTTLSTVSNEVGRYVVVNVPSGTYTMTFSKPGFTTFRVNNTVVTVGTPAARALCSCTAEPGSEEDSTLVVNFTSCAAARIEI